MGPPIDVSSGQYAAGLITDQCSPLRAKSIFISVAKKISLINRSALIKQTGRWTNGANEACVPNVPLFST